MKLGEQVIQMKESRKEWQKFVDKWNNRNEKIRGGDYIKNGRKE